MPGIINNPAVALYVATAVALVVMIGFFVYLWRLDRGVRELQRTIEARQLNQVHTGHSTAGRVENEPLRPQRIEKELSDGLNRR